MNIWKPETDTAMERIRLHYFEGYELSAHDEEVKNRWQAAFTFIMDNKVTDKEAILMLMKTYEISEAQAYRDLLHARMLFGDIRRASREGLRCIVTQWAIEMYRMAFIKKDFNGMDLSLIHI